MTTSIIIAGYVLAIIFAAVSVMLANSLRHRTTRLKAVELLNSDLNGEAIKQEDVIFRLSQMNDTERTNVSGLNSQVKLANEVRDKAVSEWNKVTTENNNLKSRLCTSYERDGKRFQKIGKV